MTIDDNGNGHKTTYLNPNRIDNDLKMKAGSGPSKYFVTGHLGSKISLADGTGSVSNATPYDSFGNTTSAVPTRYRYTGREYDEFSGV